MTPKEMAAMLRKKKANIIRAMQDALYAGVEAFKGDIIRMYYSNRPGLMRQSGTLVRGWFVKASPRTDKLNYSVVLNNSEKYGAIHETGHPGYWVAPKNKPFLAWKVKTGYITRTGKLRSKTNWVYTQKPVFIKIPKRTDVNGQWSRAGMRQTMEKVQNALRRELAA